MVIGASGVLVSAIPPGPADRRRGQHADKAAGKAIRIRSGYRCPERRS
jgi:hypothetical protein